MNLQPCHEPCNMLCSDPAFIACTLLTWVLKCETFHRGCVSGGKHIQQEHERLLYAKGCCASSGCQPMRACPCNLVICACCPLLACMPPMQACAETLMQFAWWSINCTTLLWRSYTQCVHLNRHFTAYLHISAQNGKETAGAWS